jgi:hypothetical protein
MDAAKVNLILAEVLGERARQDEKWGEQNHPNGTGGSNYHGLAETYRTVCQDAAAAGECTYADILLEEVYEAMEERDPVRLRKELVQVAAVAVQWIEAIDRRTTPR